MLTSSLTIPVKTHKIHTFEELAKSNMHILVFEGTSSYNYLKWANTSATNTILKKVERQEKLDIDDEYGYVFSNDGFAAFADSDHIEYALETKYTTPSGQAVGYIGDEKMFLSGFGVVLNRNHPLKEEVHKW